MDPRNRVYWIMVGMQLGLVVGYTLAIGSIVVLAFWK